MNELISLLSKPDFPILFKFKDLLNLNLKENELKSLIKESLNNKWIDNIYNDIFTLSGKYKKTIISGCVLAQMINPDSYISTNFVLSNNDWIPEAVYTITSIVNNKDSIITTKEYGCYSYNFLYKNYIMAGIYEIENDCGKYKTAKPLRALCDLVYQRNLKKESIGFLYDKLRLDWDSLKELSGDDFNELQGKFNIEIIEYFLKDLKRRLIE